MRQRMKPNIMTGAFFTSYDPVKRYKTMTRFFWEGDPEGHAEAARKGWQHRRKSKGARDGWETRTKEQQELMRQQQNGTLFALGKKPISFKDELKGMGKGKWRVEHSSTSRNPPFTAYTRFNTDTKIVEEVVIIHYKDKPGRCGVCYYQRKGMEMEAPSTGGFIARDVTFKEAKRIAENKIRASNMLPGSGL